MIKKIIISASHNAVNELKIESKGCSMSRNFEFLICFFLVSMLMGVFCLQIMVPFNFTEFIDDLTFQVKNNIIPMSRIDDAVRRILRVKFVMGLFEKPLADLSMAHHLGSQVCRFNLPSLKACTFHLSCNIAKFCIC